MKREILRERCAPTDHGGSNQGRKTAAEKMLGTADRGIIVANNACAQEPLRNRIFLPREISRAERRRQRASYSFRPSLPQTAHSPTPVPILTVSGAAGAKANSLQCYSILKLLDHSKFH